MLTSSQFLPFEDEDEEDFSFCCSSINSLIVVQLAKAKLSFSGSIDDELTDLVLFLS
jgi:hypothetical protein